MSGTVRIIGVPTDFGADRRGVDMGPSAIRYAGLTDHIERLGLECTDIGDLVVPRTDDTTPAAKTSTTARSKFLDEVIEVSEVVDENVVEAIADGTTPIVLGGDHSISIGSIRGTARNGEVGVLWFDAHGDFNTPQTTPSGNVHGMALAAALGIGQFSDYDGVRPAPVAAENVALIGLRDLDAAERPLIRESAVHAFTMSDIDERGMSAVIESALDRIAGRVDGIHVSLDLDWIDPAEAPGVGTPVRGGATYREAHSALEAIAERDSTRLRSIDIVEVNPIEDRHNTTAELACELVASLLGRRIL